MLYCPTCGTGNRTGARFCSHCGQPLAGTRPSQSQILHGKYRIIQLLGQGGMGATYLAEQLNPPGMRVAIRELFVGPGSTYAEQQLIEDLHFEWSMLARLNHPSLPQAIDLFAEQDRYYVVMRFIEGTSLDWEVRQLGRLPESQVLEIAFQLCDAIGYLHSQYPPTIHLDIKPDNIIMQPNGRIVLTGFDLAKGFRIGRKKRPAPRGVTPGFSPPEQYGTATDTRSDIYALGATLYNLLTGLVPPESPNRSTNTQVLIPVRQLHSDISVATERAIMRALELSPAQRFQNIPDFRAALPTPPTFSPLMLPASPARQPVRKSLADKLKRTFQSSVQELSQRFKGTTKSSNQELPDPPPYSLPNPSTGELAPLSPLPAIQDPLPPPEPSSANTAREPEKPDDKVLSLCAIARAELDENDLAIVSREYSIQAGIARETPANFAGERFAVQLPEPFQPVRFDIVVFASENIGLLSEWHKDLWFYPMNPEPQLVVFPFRVVRPGRSSVNVDFYSHRRWLRTVRLEFESVDFQPLDFSRQGAL